MLIPLRQDVGGDKLFSNVGLLLPLRAHLRDESKYSKTVTVGGNTTIVTDAAYFDGSGDYLRVNHDATTEIGAGDFTVEVDVYFTSFGDDAGASHHIVGTYTYGTLEGGTNNDGWQFGVQNAATFSFGYGLGGSWTTVFAGASSAPLNTWLCLAVTRANGAVRLFKDGKVVATATDSTDFSRSKSYVTVASYNRGDGYAFGTFISMFGYVKNIRLTKGIARYTSDYAPSSAFPVHGVARAY